MSINLTCRNCGRSIHFDDALAGSTHPCPNPKCRRPIPIPPLGMPARAPAFTPGRTTAPASSYQGMPARIPAPESPRELPARFWQSPGVYVMLALAISAGAALLIALKPGELSGFLVAMLGALPGLGAYLLIAQGRRANPVALTAGLLMPVSVLGIALSLFLRPGLTPADSSPNPPGNKLAQSGERNEAEVAILADAKRYPLTSAVLSIYPNHIVVFPTQGTIRENVGDILKSLFPPSTLTVIHRDATQRDAQREALLKEQLKKSMDGIKDLGQLNQLFSELAGKQIRFKGYLPNDPKEAVARIIQRGGVFTFSGSSSPKGAGGESMMPTQRHGSLLHTNGVEQLLLSGKLAGVEHRNLLNRFRRAIQDYAFMTDALSIVGDRPAFLIYIGRSPEAHEEAIGKLLHRMDNPVFVPRTPPRLFDAVDPTEDVGGGSATYTLRLPRKCWWREVGARDRQNLKEPLADAAKRRWRVFGPNQLIKWDPETLEFKNGEQRQVASYDIAVPVGDRVVIFRNQNLFVSRKRKDVVKLAMDYVTKRLRLRGNPSEDSIVNVHSPEGKHFFGTLLYSYLAEADFELTSENDVERLRLEEFTKRRNAEDDAPQ